MKPKRFSIGQKVTLNTKTFTVQECLKNFTLRFGEIYTVVECTVNCVGRPAVALLGVPGFVVERILDPVDLADTELEEALKEVEHQPITI